MRTLEIRRNEFAMTFKEIATVEGITRGGVWMAYASGMRKLRRLGVEGTRLKALADELDRGRAAKESQS